MSISGLTALSLFTDKAPASPTYFNAKWAEVQANFDTVAASGVSASQVSSALSVVRTGLYNVLEYGSSISRTIAAVGSGAGVVDARGLTSLQTIDHDWFGSWGGGSITLLLGPTRYVYTSTVSLPSNTVIVLSGTTFVAGAAVDCFASRSSSIGANITNNGSTLTPTVSISGVTVGDPLVVFGHVPRGGRDNTTINFVGGWGAADSTVTVTSTTGFGNNGWFRCEGELVQFASKSATEFIGCTRGNRGTTAATHADGTAVDRAVYESFVVEAVGASSLSLGNTGATSATSAGVTATSMEGLIGTQNVHFLGHGTFDGSRITSATAIMGLNVRNWTGGPQIVYRNYPSQAIELTAARECRFDGIYQDCGNRSAAVGSGQLAFSNCKDIQFAGEYRNCYIGAVIDDRTTAATLYDGPMEHCSLEMRQVFDCSFGAVLSGVSASYAHVGTAYGVDTYVIGLNAEQWVTQPTTSANVIICDTVAPNPTQGAIRVLSGASGGGNLLVSRTPGVTITEVTGSLTSNNAVYENLTSSVRNQAVWASGLSVGGTGSLIPAISSTSSLIGAFVVQGSASSFTVITWAAARANDQILVTPTSLNAAVSSLSSGIVAHSHCTQNGQIELRLSNVSTLAQNVSSKTWYFTRISPF